MVMIVGFVPVETVAVTVTVAVSFRAGVSVSGLRVPLAGLPTEGAPLQFLHRKGARLLLRRGSGRPIRPAGKPMAP